MSKPDTNQASEDELRAVVSDILTNLMIKSSLQKLDKRTDLITSGRKYIAMHNEELSTILALLRNEKLKLLDEVRERVIGENDRGIITDPDSPSYGEPYESAMADKDELRAELNKLEAEL